MPHLKTAIPIRTLNKLSEKLHYLGDALAPSHIFYRIEPVRFAGGESPKRFLSVTRHLLRVFNFGQDPKHTVRIHAYWLIVTFSPETALSATERSRIEAVVVRELFPQKQGRYAVTWHRHAFTGEADLNIIVPNVQVGLIPQLLRERGINLHNELRRALEKLTRELNEERVTEGTLPIPIITRYRRFPRLVQKLADKAKELGITAPKKENIAAIFAALGAAVGRAKLEGERLVFPARRKQGRRRFQSLEKVITEIRALFTAEKKSVLVPVQQAQRAAKILPSERGPEVSF